MPDQQLNEGSNIYQTSHEDLVRRYSAGSSPATMRDILTRQLETELYRPLYEALKQEIPSERMINECISNAINPRITKFNMGVS